MTEVHTGELGDALQARIEDANEALPASDHECACGTCAARIKLMQVQMFQMHAVFMPLMAAIMENPMLAAFTGGGGAGIDTSEFEDDNNAGTDLASILNQA